MVIVVQKITVFTVFLDQINAALLSKREILKKNYLLQSFEHYRQYSI